jgi:hypothetical protein
VLALGLVQPSVTDVSDPAAVVATIQAFTVFLVRYLAALAAVGAFSMAFVETIKTLVDARTWFQTRRFVKWMSATPFERAGVLARNGEKDDKERPLAELLRISTALSESDAIAAARRLLQGKGWFPGLFGWWREPSHALFALELPKMMGAVQDAADVALNSPARYPAFYLLMVSGADTEDVRAWHEQANQLIATVSGQPSPADRLLMKDRADVYARLKLLVKRKLDTFQLNTSDRWATGNQLVANAAGVLTLSFVLMYLSRHSAAGAAHQLDPIEIILLSLLGGILAPVAKDLVSTLQRVKNG